MSNQALEAWSTRSLHGLTAWKRPEPTKWAVVVILCARATKRENEVFTDYCFRPGSYIIKVRTLVTRTRPDTIALTHDALATLLRIP